MLYATSCGLAHSKLDTLWRTAAQVGLPFRADTRASFVSVGYRHWLPHLLRLAKPCATACHPSTRATLIAHSRPLTLMNLRYRYAIVPNALKVALINVTAAMAW
ncbi:MAG: hypothetical protein J6X22_00430 [Muribaculaceae bacterium]|nr:hypothetical protein [Muribaculaceae bacterium]